MRVKATGMFLSLSRRSTGGVEVELTGPMTIASTPFVSAVRMLVICSVGELWESISM